MFKFITDNMAVLTLVCAIAAFFYPPLFLLVKDYFLWLFAITMFGVGLVLPLDEAKEALRKPSSIVIGVVSQYTIMPLLGFAQLGSRNWGQVYYCINLERTVRLAYG